MNEAETRAEHMDPVKGAREWGRVFQVAGCRFLARGLLSFCLNLFA